MEGQLPSGPARAPGTRRRTFVLALGAAIVLIAAIIWFAGADRIASVATSIGWSGIAWLFLIYSATQLTRAARIWTAVRPEIRPRFGQLLCISAVHQLLNHVMPARLGEFGFPLLMKRFTAVPASSAVSLLVFVRLQEIFVLALIFGIAVLTIVENPPLSVRIAGFAIMVVVFAIEWMIRPILRHMSKLLEGGRSESRFTSARERLAAFLKHVEVELAVPLTPPRRISLFVLTVLVWLSNFFFFHEVLRLSGTGVSFGATIVGSSIANLSQVLPVNAVGSFGSLEAGWTLGFSLVGIDSKTALASGLVMHVLVLVYIGLLAGPSWLVLSMRGRGERSKSRD